MNRYARLVRPTARHIGRLLLGGILLFNAVIIADIGTGFADDARKPLLQAGKKTIYERVLTQPGAGLHGKAGEAGAGKALPAMSILYVYARQDESGASWIEVGPNADGKTIGWLPEKDALPWKQQLTLAFTNPAGRERGLMFGQRDPLDKLLAADKPGEEAAKLRQVIASGNVPDGFPVIAMEPQNYIDISKQFYLLPILEAQDAAMGMGYPVRELHIASVPADPAAEKPAASDASQQDMLANFTAGVVFVVDSTKSMDPYIDRTRQAVEKMYDQIQGKMVGSRASFGLVAFRAGAKEDKAIGYDSKVFVDPNKATDKKTFLAAVKGLSASKVSTPRFSEDSYAGIMTALNDIDWSHFGARYIVLVTDAGALDGNDKFSSTKLNADQVRLFAQERGVAIYALHLLTKEGVSNHDQAAAQYKTVSSYPNLSKPLYYPIADGSVTQFGSVVDLLSQAIVKQVTDAASGKTAVGAEAPSDGSSVASQVASDTAAVGYAMRLAYLGRVSKTTAPKLVEAWTVDRDFAKPDVATMDVRVLLTKNQLSDLQQVLKTVLDVGKAKQLDPTGFFDAIRSAAAAMGRDPAKLKDPNATKLGQLGLIGEYIDDLPYKSKVMGIDQDIWQGWSISEQQFFLDEIERKLALYQKLNDDADRWVALSPNAPAGEYVYPIPIDALP
ncbi:MAG: vWA domain-containing protein [Dongiaceae bacterium]